MQQEEMRTVVEFASLAPSVHNTQPWRFVARADALDVYADLDRELHYLDPSGRQLHISCGAVVEFARLAVRAIGYEAEVRVRPDPADPSLVATIRTGNRSEADPEEQQLIEAAVRRYTDRGPYSGEPLSAAEVDRLRDAAATAGCWLRVVDRPEDRLVAITLLAEAERMESADTEYHAELERWLRDASTADGIPNSAYTDWVEGRVSDVPLRDFSGNDRHPHPGPEVPPTVERDAIVLMGTETDDEHSWLNAGRAVARVLLTLTDAGLVSQPLGPVLDVPTTRARLRHDLGLLGQPQLMLRVGHGFGRPHTGRRSVEDVFAVKLN